MVCAALFARLSERAQLRWIVDRVGQPGRRTHRALNRWEMGRAVCSPGTVVRKGRFMLTDRINRGINNRMVSFRHIIPMRRRIVSVQSNHSLGSVLSIRTAGRVLFL